MINYLNHVLVIGEEPEMSLSKFSLGNTEPSKILAMKGSPHFYSSLCATEIDWEYLKSQRLSEVNSSWSPDTDGLWDYLQEVNFWDKLNNSDEQSLKSDLSLSVIEIFTDNAIAHLLSQRVAKPSKEEFLSRMKSVAMPVIYNGVFYGRFNPSNRPAKTFEKFDRDFWTIIESVEDLKYPQDKVTCYQIS